MSLNKEIKPNQKLYIWPMARETWVQSQVELYQRLKKWYLIPPCLTLTIIRYGSSVKRSNPEKGVEPSPTPQCSSYWKGSLLVVLDNSRQFDLLYSCLQGHWPDVKSVHQWSVRPELNPDRIIPKTQKMILDTVFLNTRHYKVRIKDKME